MIHMEDVCFGYDLYHNVLDNINLNIEDGEFVFIIGKSGAGKSSLFKLLSHEYKPTSGKLIVNGQDLVNLPRKKVPFYRRSVGMVFQDFRLINKMTVFDNVAFVLRVTNHSTRYIKKRVPDVLSMVNLSNKADKYPGELSGGEQQRIAIARALASSPSLLIADEPTGNIDPELSQQLIKVLIDINKYLGVTIIVITHEHNLIKNFNKRVIEIENGTIKRDIIPTPEKDTLKDKILKDNTLKLERDVENKTSDNDTSEENIIDEKILEEPKISEKENILENKNEF